MKKLFIAFLFVFTANTFAQMPKTEIPRPGKIFGKVVESSTKQSLPYVTIVVKDVSKKIITGGITNDDGTFEIKDIPEGKNSIEF